MRTNRRRCRLRRAVSEERSCIYPLSEYPLHPGEEQNAKEEETNESELHQVAEVDCCDIHFAIPSSKLNASPYYKYNTFIGLCQVF